MIRVREILLSLGFCCAASLVLAQGADRREGRPEDRGPAERGPRERAPADGPAFRVLPPFAQRELGLSAEQQQQIEALEADVQAKMQKILTPEQLKQWTDRRGQRGPRGEQPSDRPGAGRRDRTEQTGPDRPRGADDNDSRRSRQGRGAEDRRDGSARGDRTDGPLGRVVKELKLTPEQQTKVDAELKEHHEKVRALFRQAQADLLERMKGVLTDEQFQQFTKALENGPPGFRRRDRQDDGSRSDRRPTEP